MQTPLPSSPFQSRKGAALIITLAFVVLLTVVIVAYFSRVISERQVSSGSANQTKVELFAQGAADTIIGDLKQEIAAGSVAVAPSPSPASGMIYKPANALAILPFRVGQAAVSGTNLIKQSLNVTGTALPFYSGTTYDTGAYPPPARASLLPTDTSTSLNGRSISRARWNEPLLLPVTSISDYTPLPATGFTAPDWILVERSGSNPIVSSTEALPAGSQWSASNSTTVIGRYAYNIYDEGGLLDMNVAGYPSNTSTSQFTFKPALSYADLTQVGLTQAQVDAIVGWRNNSSTEVTGSFPSYVFPSASGTNYYNSVISNPNGFLATSGTALNNNGTASQSAGQSDRVFTSRQQLIQFLLDDPPQNTATNTLLTTVNSLQYLGTFSRDINQPSYIRLQSTNATKTLDYNPNAPKVLQSGQGGEGGNSAYKNPGIDDQINPSFESVRVTGAFVRNDGSQAAIGEPVVKRRFALNRLAWLTYKGPSADVIKISGTSDANIQALIADGIPLAYLEQGSDLNIQKYFGLTWAPDLNGDSGFEWYYNYNNNDPAGQASAKQASLNSMGPILQLDTIAGLGLQAHEPDFFELLKATINVGSIGKALLPYGAPVSQSGALSSGWFMPSDDAGVVPPSQQPYNYNYYAESSVDFQVMQIGANIISQFQPANYPARIVFNDGDNGGKSPYAPHTFAGVVNLPYFYNVLAGVLELDPPNPMPRNGKSAYSGPANSGTTLNAGYQSGDQITSSGVAAVMELPVIWNPHDPSSPTTNAAGLSPGAIRVVADSCTPDQTSDYAATSGTYWSFFTFGASVATTVPSGAYQYSCNADPSSKGDASASGDASNSWFCDPSQTGGSIMHTFQNPATGSGNEEIDITINPSGNTFCPEPMMLMRPITSGADFNGNTFSVSVPNSQWMRQDPAVKGYFKNGGLTYYLANGANMASGEKQDPAGTSYIGLYLGAFPLAWYCPAGAAGSGKPKIGLSAEQSGGFVTRQTSTPLASPPGSDTSCYMTYRMQYQDAAGNWITYDTKYGKVTNDQIEIAIGPALNAGGAQQSTLLCGFMGLGGLEGYWASCVDPRSSRFGLFWTSTEQSSSISNGGDSASAMPGPEMEWKRNVSDWSTVKANATGWLDTANGILYTGRPDPDAGFYFCSNNATNHGNPTPQPDSGWLFGNPSPLGSQNFYYGQASGWMAFVYSSDGQSYYPGLAPGLLSENNTDVFFEPHRFFGSTLGAGIGTPNYFADPDGMVRRAMGAFVPTGVNTSPGASLTSSQSQGTPPSADTAVGLPMARVFKWQQSNTNVPSEPNPTINPFTPSSTSMSGTSQAQSRPYFLHRPFRSVAELGYVFSDTPWRNLDFSTAESGNSALLDVFCVNDDTTDANGLVAGRVNLNTRQTPVLQAVLAGAYLDPAEAASTIAVTGSTLSLNAATAQAVAGALVARTSDTNNIVNGTGPLQNVSELVGKWVQNTSTGKSTPIGQLPGLGSSQGALSSASGFYDGKLSYAGFSGGVWDNTSSNLGSTSREPFVNGVEDFTSATGTPKLTGTAEDIYSAYYNSSQFSHGQFDNGSRESAGYIERFREGPIRAMANVGETRVWNLLIDVIAQTGRYPQTATKPADFLVEGEQRYWVHVAIDRYTGQVLDKQIEVVKE